MRFQRKLLSVALVLILVLTSLPVLVLANDNIRVTIDGQEIIFEDQAPVIVDSRTLVPVRGVFEALGFVPDWDRDSQTATLTRDDYVVIITVGSDVFTTNGVRYKLDVPAQLIGGRTMLPIRAVLESVGYELDWDSRTRTVVITSGVADPSAPSTVPNTSIGRHLRIAYTIQTDEHSSTEWNGRLLRWQFLDLDGDLNLDNFPVFTSYALPNIFNSNLGDAFIVLWDSGMRSIIIDLGNDQLHRHWLPRDFNHPDLLQELVPVAPRPSFEKFGMYHRYVSDNFYFYSNKANAQWLSDLAAGVEDQWYRLMEVFDTPSQRIIVYLFDIDDLVEAAYFWVGLDDLVRRHGHYLYPGNAHWMDHYIAIVSGPRGRTEVTDNLIALTLHEVVHVLQRDVTNWNALPGDWIHEGAAHFLAGTVAPAMYILTNQVRLDNLPTLNLLETPGINSGAHRDHAMFSIASASIFQFVSSVFGMEYIVPMHTYPGDFMGIFGLSRTEFEQMWHLYLRDTFR